MWLLRNGKRIRVVLKEDPVWNKSDKWSARNLYAKFMYAGYSSSESASLASVGVWKKKWDGIAYADWIENALRRAS